MNWHNLKKYKPISNAKCFVVTENQMVYVAMYKFSMEHDDYVFVEQFSEMPMDDVTHFCIPEPIKIQADLI